MRPNGQLPHHFVGVEPQYVALSGLTQTGPNVFWIKSCFNYARETGNSSWLASYMPKLRTASRFLFDLIDPEYNLASVPGSLMIDVFIRNNLTSDTNAMLVGFFSEFADAEEALETARGQLPLRALSSKIASAMNIHLWSEDDDHYITQLNPKTNMTRDFVDYDSNLIAAANGVPTRTMASRMFRRIDSGQCSSTQTFVSERYYGKNDTTGGNTGDSWCAMARIAWYNALARKRFGDAEGFSANILSPLQDTLLRVTYMHERLFCDGTQQMNRTAMYFEYPAAIALLVRRVKYGIELGFNSVNVSPFTAPSEWSYNVGNVRIYFSQAAVDLLLPGDGGDAAYTIDSLSISAVYRILTCDGKPVKEVRTDSAGTLRFIARRGDCEIQIRRE